MMGLGVGAAAGAASGLIYILASRGPDAVVAKGSTVEMVLDRPIVFSEAELDFSNAPPRPAPLPSGADKGGA
jgi:type IV secretion system protein VirB10